MNINKNSKTSYKGEELELRASITTFASFRKAQNSD